MRFPVETTHPQGGNPTRWRARRLAPAPPVGEFALRFALPLTVSDRLSLVELLLSAPEADLHLAAPTALVEAERDQREALHLHLGANRDDLFLM